MSEQKIRAIFSKEGDLRFISHLDLMRLFQKASRRALLPVAITKGFNPRLKISITRALKLGISSRAEEAIFYMDKEIDANEFMEKINEALPDGVKIISV